MSRRVASFDEAVRLLRLRQVWFDACRAAGITLSSEAHDALIAGALKRNAACCQTLYWIARSASSGSGRQIRSESVAVFEHLSMARRAVGLFWGYVWSEANGVFGDATSCAIQKALPYKSFNPRHAHALQKERSRQRADQGPASATLWRF
jgi:hypothetical protein